MNDKPAKKKLRARPLLVAAAGVAMIAMGACGGATSGNLVAPRCPDGGIDTNGDNCQDAGTKADAGDGG